MLEIHQFGVKTADKYLSFNIVKQFDQSPSIPSKFKFKYMKKKTKKKLKRKTPVLKQ